MAVDVRPLTVAMMLETDGPGGAEVVVLQLAEELRRRGHTVVPVGPVNGDGWLSGQLAERGFEREVFVLKRPVDPSCAFDLARKLKARGVDVLHSHEFTMAVYGAAAARLMGRPHVTTMHGNQKMTRVLRRRMALRWAFRKSRAVVAVSQSTKRSLDADLGLAAGAVDVIPNGIPVRPGDAEPVRRELGLRENEVLLLAVGNLDERKGHIILLRALAQLEDEGVTVPWRLAIAGGRGGPEHPRLNQFIAGRGWEHRAHVLLQRNDIPNLQTAADIFVMPSLWEGLPLAVLEGMHAGNPIVATEASGIPEAVTSGQEGLLVPPADVPALAAALRRLLEDPAERRRMGDAARARALANHTIGGMAEAYERLYRGDG